ncbi:MAG: 2-amino-4-hydroxy-6-hydroxymethyldihydropteridine diphosphokinase [Elusimicrobiota bacterium]
MTPGADCLIALGSNRGRRRSHIRFALRALDLLPRTRLLRRSSLHETAPVGGPPQRHFINAAALIRTRLSPMGLLVELKRLEASCGRRPGPRWGPRPLDLDILYYGRKKLRTRYLRVPHPLVRKRQFVLAPLAEVSPSRLGGKC